ncbi:hypothetical protein ACOSQ3_000109 [Xanthoceras sorbifolium]
MGRGKVELKRIENQTSRQVTFSKRKNGILKKAYELSLLCDAEVAMIIFSSSGKVYQFATDDEMDRIIARYRNEVGLLHSNHKRFRTLESWKSEIEELQKSIDIMEARLRHFCGEDISTMGIKELKQLERQLRVGVDRIRSKKRRIMSEQINSLKRRQKELQEENHRLQQMVKLQEIHDVNLSLRNLGANRRAKYQQSLGYDLVLGSVAAIYVFTVPYTKVEESFNVQTHSFHRYFTSALPGSLLAAYPLLCVMQELPFISISVPIFNLFAAVAAASRMKIYLKFKDDGGSFDLLVEATIKASNDNEELKDDGGSFVMLLKVAERLPTTMKI